ncbi:SUMF1/EgtB/PvdO family nonheme iron enzyme [Jiulongibacter sediminis]|uniref:Sulfatase-modifying factor enzyme-like domain-containing protein n=1 Tax=Jiulongibacter sediminis TaxID=1605367 RepID=A0A0P7BDK7_9BACT|nr:SUMF1/EgtB/PvdO family nonheme iron enzyme [Jiulongibacter sediminis]KPM48814.1 hypothetical protein AFM12_09575 [Jiulongibacter sediminis]TBX25345.1 hypothetical protein TK44_09580 [Jiulongibacter sediminis]
MKNVFCIFLFVSTFCSSVFAQEEKIIPPNIYFVNDTLGCDITEVANMDYLFYQYSMLKNKDSAKVGHYSEYLKVWVGDEPLPTYMGHPKTRLHPVVGLSLEQAKEYARWRTLAVCLRWYHKQRLISQNTVDEYENRTLEEFAEEFSEIVKKYPYFEYRIPTSQEWNICFETIENDLKENKSRYKRFKRLAEKWSPYNFKDLEIDKQSEYYVEEVPLAAVVDSERKFKRFLKIYGLKGGVAEMVSDAPVAMGGSWKDNSEEFERVKMQEFKEPNAWTGFRCVGSWKKWKSNE